MRWRSEKPPEPSPPEPSLAEKTVECIRSTSKKAQLITLTTLQESLDLESTEELGSLLGNSELGESYPDIRCLQGRKASYYFSDQYISENYANMLMRVEEQDLAALVAGTIRDESRMYPRPTDARLFQAAPFKLSHEQVLGIVENMQKTEEYQDIHAITASNGAVYFFSSQHLTKAHAEGLMEWTEVKSHEIP